MVLLLTLATLAVAFALKSPCLSDWPVRHQPKGCYNDIQTLWDSRHLALHLFPYQGTVTKVDHSTLDLMNVVLGPGQIEYPVVTGMFAWLTSLVVDSRSWFLVASALALTPIALLAAQTLHVLAPGRVLLFAMAPGLAAYAFLNWDLLPVAAAAGGVWAWHRGRPGLAGGLLAAGASAKLWPGFLVLPLLLSLLLSGQRRDAGRVFGAAAVTTLVLNGPFLVANAAGWAGPFVAQSARQNDYTTNSLWYFVAGHLPLRTLNVVSAGSVVVVWSVLLLFGLRRWRREGSYPWLSVGGAMVTSYIVLSRVDSPQYGLWVLPFLVLLVVPRRWVVLFVVTDLWLWLQWSWLYYPLDLARPAAQVTRIAVMGAMTVVLLRSPSAVNEPEAAQPGSRDGRPAVPAPRAPEPRSAPLP